MDGDGVPNSTDMFPTWKKHYQPLKNNGLWEWPAFVMSWTFSGKNKMNSLKTCMDFSDYKNSLSGLENRWTIIAGGGAIGFFLRKLPIAGWIMILAAGIANAAHQARGNAEDVYARVCGS